MERRAASETRGGPSKGPAPARRRRARKAAAAKIATKRPAAVLLTPSRGEAVLALGKSAASLASLTGAVRKAGLQHATEGWVLETLLAMGHLLVDRRKKTEEAAERLATALFGDRFDDGDDDDGDELGDGIERDPTVPLDAATIRFVVHKVCDGFVGDIQSSPDPSIHHEAVAEISRVRAVVGPVKDPKPKKAH